MRLFVGVGVSEDLHRGLVAALPAWRDLGPDLKWVRPELFHLTLQFIGEGPDTMVEPLADALFAVQQAPFTLVPGNLSTLPHGGGLRRARVLALSFGEGAGDLVDLAARVNTATGALGLPTEQRPFRAHLTLARARRGGSIPAALAPEQVRTPILAPWLVSEFHLYRSRLGSGGPNYDILRSYQLKGSKDARA